MMRKSVFIAACYSMLVSCGQALKHEVDNITSINVGNVIYKSITTGHLQANNAFFLSCPQLIDRMLTILRVDSSTYCQKKNAVFFVPFCCFTLKQKQK